MVQPHCTAGYDGLGVVSRGPDGEPIWERSDAHVHVTGAVASTNVFLAR